MYHYNVAEWILLFFIYGFFGWIFETTYVSLRKCKFVNRGFLRGPILPIYASGAIIMLFASIPFQGNFVAIYFAGMIAATLLELVVGLAMESIFKVKYWDYSNQKIQYKGVICLSSSIAWGFLTLFLTEVIHKPVEHILFSVPEIAQYPSAALLSLIFAVDMVLSVRTALDMRKMLEKMDKMRRDLKVMESQLAAQIEERIENAEEKADAMRTAVERRVTAMKENAEGRAENVREAMEEQKEILRLSSMEIRVRITEYMEQYREEIKENTPEKWTTYEAFREKIAQYKDYTKSYGRMKAAIIKAHPSAISVKYRESYQDMKAAVEEKLHKNKNEEA